MPRSYPSERRSDKAATRQSVPAERRSESSPRSRRKVRAHNSEERWRDKSFLSSFSSENMVDDDPETPSLPPLKNRQDTKSSRIHNSRSARRGEGGKGSSRPNQRSSSRSRSSQQSSGRSRTSRSKDKNRRTSEEKLVSDRIASQRKDSNRNSPKNSSRGDSVTDESKLAQVNDGNRSTSQNKRKTKVNYSTDEDSYETVSDDEETKVSSWGCFATSLCANAEDATIDSRDSMMSKGSSTDSQATEQSSASSSKDMRGLPPNGKKSQNGKRSNLRSRQSPKAVKGNNNQSIDDASSKNTTDTQSHTQRDPTATKTKKDETKEEARDNTVDPWSVGTEQKNSFPPFVAESKKAGPASMFAAKSKKNAYMKMNEQGEAEVKESESPDNFPEVGDQEKTTEEREAGDEAGGKAGNNKRSVTFPDGETLSQYSNSAYSKSSARTGSRSMDSQLSNGSATMYSRLSFGLINMWGAQSDGNPAKRTSSAIVYTRYGDADVLSHNQVRPVPYALYPQDVVVRVEASSVSINDCLIRRNRWHKTIPLPNTPGCDCVGRVTHCDEEAENYGIKVGDRVAIIDPQLGGNSRYVKADATKLIVHVPEDLDSAVAVSIILSFLPAYQCLHRVGNVAIEKGQNVLVTNAHTPFGQAAIQLSVLLGATVYAFAEPRFKGQIEELGGVFIDTNPTEWLCTVMETMDIVLFSKGLDYFDLAHNALKERGKIVCVGEYESWWNESVGKNLTSIWATGQFNQVFCYDFVMSSSQGNRELISEDLDIIFDMVANEMITPPPFKRIALSSVASAHRELEGRPVDKVNVCMPWRKSSSSDTKDVKNKERANKN